VVANRKSRAKASSHPYGLRPRHWLFCQELVIDENATAAYLRAGYKNTPSACDHASRLAGNGRIKKAMADLRAAKAEKLQVNSEEVLARWLAIARADPNELIEVRRVCCRFCHGKAFRYQRTQGEMEAARAFAQKVQAAVGSTMPAFDDQGGISYDARKDPHPHCPECFGEGVPVVFVKDTRHLSAGARLLYAGAKETENGIEIKMLDRAAALLNVAKHLGMFTTKVEHEHTGEGGAIPIKIIEIVMPPNKIDEDAIPDR
jgi:phage terminase small subunit